MATKGAYKYRLRIQLIGFVLSIIVVTICLALSYRPNITVELSSRAKVTFKPSSLYQILTNGKSFGMTDIYVNKVPPRYISFWQDLSDRPVLITGPYENGKLLCLYDYDTDFRLLEVFPSDAPIPFDTNSDLPSMVYGSSCRILEANVDDWKVMSAALAGLSQQDFKEKSVPIYHFGIVVIHGPLAYVKRNVERQIAVMQKFGSSKCPVPNH